AEGPRLTADMLRRVAPARNRFSLSSVGGAPRGQRGFPHSSLETHMAANVEAAEDTAPAATSESDGAQANGLATMERTYTEPDRNFEKTGQDSLEALRAQSRAYADLAGQQIDEAQRYVVERVQDRPLVSTDVAVGIGMILGLLQECGRRR